MHSCSRKWIESHGQYGEIRYRYMDWVTRMDKESAEREYIKGTQGEILRTQWKGMREIIPVDDTGHWAQHHLTASTHRPIHIGNPIKQRPRGLRPPSAINWLSTSGQCQSATSSSCYLRWVAAIVCISSVLCIPLCADCWVLRLCCIE